MMNARKHIQICFYDVERIYISQSHFRQERVEQECYLRSARHPESEALLLITPQVKSV